MIVQDYIEQAARRIGILQAGRSLATGEYTNCLNLANQLLSAFSIEGLTIYQIKKETFSLTGAASYTIGSTGTFNTSRPEKIRAAAVVTGSVSMPCQIVSAEKFATIIDRGVTGAFADWLACDYQFPLATIFLWPAPAAGSLDLWSVKPLAAFSAISDTVSFPPGYEDAFSFNLAVNMASEFAGAHLDQAVVAKAHEAKQALAAINGVSLGQPMAPIGVSAQQPLTMTDIEKGQANQ